MNNNFIDVHTFDGLLKQSKQFTPVDKDKKISLFQDLIKKLSNPLSIKMVNIMIKDIDTGLNFQPENNLDSGDIFCAILEKDYTEMLSIIEEQLVDIFLLGQCPSGRVTRLLSIYLAL
jgi:hypothetical protein